MVRLPLDLAFHAVDQAVCVQFRQQASVRQRAILVAHSGMLDHPLDWHDDHGKAVQLKALQTRIRNVQPFRYALIGEAWVTSWISREVPLTPSKSEIRRECFYIFVCDQEGENVLGYREIVRASPWDASEPTLGDLVVENAVSGVFADFLT